MDLFAGSDKYFQCRINEVVYSRLSCINRSTIYVNTFIDKIIITKI